MKILVHIALISVSMVFLPAKAEEFCEWRPRDIANPADIRGTTLVLTTDRDTFGIYNSCVTILRRQFGGSLNFALVNRFSKNIGITTGYAFVKSIRILSSSPPIKLSLTRGGGWITFQKENGPPKPARVMNFEPYRGTIESWNDAYSKPGTPLDFGERLHSPWHAYADVDKIVASSDTPDFWKVNSTFDQIHGVITNYLLHFDVNTEPIVSQIPFTVFIQPEVQRFELLIISNPESLNGTYKFVVQ
jgi:hypothetical protein